MSECDRLDAVADLVKAIRTQIPTPWPAPPNGWRGEIEAALLDAVLSIRARYGGQDTGVRGGITCWREYRCDAVLDDLAALTSLSTDQLADKIGHQRLPGGQLKAAAIVQAATGLLQAGVRHAADVNVHSEQHRLAYQSVRGLGPVTWRYLLMLLGTPGIKADTWITRFVRSAVKARVSSPDAEALLMQAARLLNADPTALDHAIWAHARAH